MQGQHEIFCKQIQKESFKFAIMKKIEFAFTSEDEFSQGDKSI